MSEVKYDAVFGDQSLFNNAPNDAILAVKDNSYPVFYSGVNNPHAGMLSVDSAIVKIAMRRIIKTPVWTVADQEAGRLPEVGALLVNIETGDQFSFVGVNAGSKRWACKDACDGLLYFFKPHEMSPIETPEERAHRLRSEWVKHALDLYMSSPKNDIDSMGDVYDALLSGELQAPDAK